MLSKITFLLAFVAFSVAITKEEANAAASAELKADGMSQASINALTSLDSKFALGFATVSGNKKKTDKFVEDFRLESQSVINAMPASDKAIYDAFLVKKGLLA